MSISRKFTVAPLATLGWALLFGLGLAGCGGVGNEVVSTAATPNTALTITAAAIPKLVNLGSSGIFSVTVADADGIASVSATLDGKPIAITASGSTYSITIPPTLAAGDHTLVVSGTGKAPDGTLEVPRSASVVFTVQANTPASFAAVSGVTHYTVGAGSVLSTVITDPNGISSVTATLDGQAIAVAQTGTTYSVTLPTTLPAGNHSVVLTVVGLMPDGTPEPPATVTQAVTVYPPNTPLTINSAAGTTAYYVGSAQTYSVTVVDPDLISSVVATLDGAPIPVSAPSGATYTVVIPGTTAPGSHSLVVTAIGTQPNGSLETPQSVTVKFTVYPLNTPLLLGGVVPTTATQASLFLAANFQTTLSVYTVAVSDPDGISSVSARIYSIDGSAPVTVPPAPLGTVFYPALSKVAPDLYTFNVAANAFACGRYIEFTAVGLNPDGSLEQPVIQALDTSSGC